jgi:exopolyphosphatase / guanosine-5'-triphosphate,3'-diphosphate pyrophosphatase
VAAPVQLSAIDAGSNAIRLVIARATSPRQIQILETERAAVRLGHNAFTERLLDDETIARAVRAFRHFRERMDHYQVTAYRAVATSAAREVRNGRKLMERIRRKSGIKLEVISSAEEARLVCSAVHWVLGGRVEPRLIFDLGGGSLELNFFERGLLTRRIALPLGTIRVMETFGLEGAIDEDQARRLAHHVLALLRSALPSPPNLARAIAVGCGGNAEALVRLAAGPPVAKTPAINVRLLRDQMWRILGLDIPSRMRAFRVRKDRAEVMGIAAIIIHTVARWLELRSILVPGVGVREGLLLDLVAEQYSGEAPSDEQRDRAERLLAGVRWFARRHNTDWRHAEQVAQLALSLFDQMRPLHEMGAEMRLVLEMGALLHDIGHFVSRKAHHRHGEYLVRWGEIAGLGSWRREMVAALIRYHNCKSEPQVGHACYAALDNQKRRQLRLLTSFLRIAEKLESEHAQRISGVDVQIAGRRAIFLIGTTEGTRLDLTGLGRKADLFEKEFQLRAEFRRDQRREKVA